jgi:ABC-type nitrate/sulfonate/bicarbonate transport system substrate-binding protein
MSWAPVYVAKDKGFFAREGLTPEVVHTSIIRKPNGGYESYLEHLLEGKTDFIVPLIPSIRAVAGGADLKLVCGMSLAPDHRIIGQKTIKTVKDLKGKRIMVKAFGYSADLETRFILRKHGLDPERDVTILESGPGLQETQLDALRKGWVDAVTVAPPHDAIGEAEGFRLVDTLIDKMEDWIGEGWITTSEIIKKEPQLVQAAVRALVRAEEFARTKRKETVDVLLKNIRLLDRKTAYTAYDRLKHAWRPEIPDRALRNVIEACCQILRLPKVAAAQFVDRRFLEKAL